MTSAIGLISLLLFAVAFWHLGVVRAAGGALAVVRQVASVVRDPQSSDLVKEAAARGAAFQLLASLCSIAVRGGLAGLVSVLPVWMADATGLVRQEAVLAYLSRWEVMALASFALTAAYVVGVRLCRLKHPTRL